MSFIQDALRTSAPAEQLETVSILDVQKEIGFTDLRFAHHNNTGSDLLHLITPNGKYLSVKIGKKASTTEGDELVQMRHLINNNLIYTGVNEGNRWFTFGQRATLKPTKTVSFADLMKSGNILSAATASEAAAAV